MNFFIVNLTKYVYWKLQNVDQRSSKQMKNHIVCIDWQIQQNNNVKATSNLSLYTLYVGYSHH